MTEKSVEFQIKKEEHSTLYRAKIKAHNNVDCWFSDVAIFIVNHCNQTALLCLCLTLVLTKVGQIGS